MSLFSSLCWVRRGCAKAIPDQFKIKEEDLEEYEEEAKKIMQDDPEKVKKMKEKVKDAGSRTAMGEDDEIVRKYGLEDYDKEEDDDADFTGVRENLFYKPGEDDPDLIGDDEGEKDDLDDVTIQDSDALLVVGVTDEEEFSHISVYLYENEENNLYIHHDLTLSAFPLCLAWMNFSKTPATDGSMGRGNMLAVGTFLPEIEIWDLDVIDILEPDFKLGGYDDPPLPSSSSSSKKKKTAKPKLSLKEKSHTDAVMSLSWNKLLRNILASGSADKTVKVWDLNTEKCLETISSHSDKVQSIQWHHTEQAMLLSGSYDKTVALTDARSPGQVLKWSFSSDVEVIQWNPHSQSSFFVSTDDGLVRAYDVGNPNPIWTLSAHHKAVSGLSLNPSIPNLMATASTDKTLKLWDLTDNKPALIYSAENFSDQLFSVSWNEDLPNLLGVAGKDKLEVFDVFSWSGVADRFGRNRARRNQ